MDNKTSVKVNNPPGGQSSFSLSHEPDASKTSVKVHQQPGGNSSFQLGGGYGENTNVKPTTSVKVHQQAATNNIFGGYEQPQQQQQAPNRRNPNQTSSNIFGGPEEPQKAAQKPQQQQQPTQQQSEVGKTSVKVHNPPGGKSNFTLG